MKLPSIGQLFHSARATFLRFPIVLCDAVIGTAAALLLVDREGAAQPTILFPILFASILGLPLFISLRLLAEHKMWKSPATFGIHIIGLLLLVGYGLVIPQDYLNAPGFHLVRFLILAAALHLLVSVVPFYERGELNGFCHVSRYVHARLQRRRVHPNLPACPTHPQRIGQGPRRRSSHPQRERSTVSPSASRRDSFD